MKKSLLVFLIFILVETIPVSCNFICPCGSCDSGPAKKIDIVSWQMQTVSDKYLGVDPDNPHLYDQVYKALNIDQRNLVFNEKSLGGSPFNSAYACSPAPLESIQTFANIQVKSVLETAYLNAADIIHAGDDITDRFVMTFLFDMNFIPVPEFINSLIIYDQDKYQFRLKEKPFQETNLKFDVLITMSDGKVFEFKNELLTVY
jgi:hypothetical protein